MLSLTLQRLVTIWKFDYIYINFLVTAVWGRCTILGLLYKINSFVCNICDFLCIGVKQYRHIIEIVYVTLEMRNEVNKILLF